MKIRFLLDTNIISEPVQLIPNSHVLKKMKAHDSEMATASIVWHELLFGVKRLEKSRRKDQLQDYLTSIAEASLPILVYDEKAATWHATERARLQKLGIQTPFADAQIAAIAHTNDLILVTRNKADFKCFKNLQIENWFA